ncbi:hypothetical protein [Streptomyces chrestomyceticus]|uniref:hypothetical protein n=1 Tax=Streptomyces chrestomyceticus TaxID=68185 RepID=UPI0033DDA20E
MSDYVEPDDRPSAWARMAVDLAARGHTHAEIGDALCIDEPTALALLLPTTGSVA